MNFQHTIEGIFNDNFCKELSPSNVVSLYKAIPWIIIDIELMKVIWIKRATDHIKNHLFQIGWTEELILELKRTNSYIAGSFPLQCLLNEFWDESDIDIFVPPYEKSHNNRWYSEIFESFIKMVPYKFEVLFMNGFSEKAKKFCIECTKDNKEKKVTDICCNHIFGFDDLVKEDLGDQLISYFKEENFPDGFIIIKIIANIRNNYNKLSNKLAVFNYLKKLLIKHFPVYIKYIKQLLNRIDDLDDINSKMLLNNYLMDQGQYKEMNITHITSCLFKNKKVQIINIKDSNPVDFINKFDFDFCKVFFDGEKVVVSNWDSILTQSSLIHGERKEKRIEKYQKRGFTIKEKD